MSRVKDIVGQTHKMLTVISNSGELFQDGSVLWNCKCECGRIKKLTSVQFRTSTSCGCYRHLKDRKYNTYLTLGNTTYVYDSKGNYTLIDTDMLKLVKYYYWFKDEWGYFVTCTGIKKPKRLRLHNFIYTSYYGEEIPKGYEIDHKNRKKYDNRRNNFRKATRAENNINHGVSSSNTSGYVGVSYLKTRGKYRAYITVNYKQISLGLYDTPEEAHMARLEAEKKYYGEFSSL